MLDHQKCVKFLADETVRGSIHVVRDFANLWAGETGGER